MLHTATKTWYRSIKESFSLWISTPSCCLPLYFLGFFSRKQRSRPIWVRLGYCFTPYQRLWLYNGAPLVAFYDTLGIRRTTSGMTGRFVLQQVFHWLLSLHAWLILGKPFKNIHVIIYKLLDLICICIWKRCLLYVTPKSRYGMQKTYDMMQSKFLRNFGIRNKFIGVGNGDIGARVNIQCPPPP